MSMQVAAFFTNFVLSTLTDIDASFFVEQNMKSEYINIYHKHLEGADIEKGNQISFKAMVVQKTLEDLIKDIPSTNSLDGGKPYKLINGVYIKQGQEIPYDVLTEPFIEALNDTYESIKCLKNICYGLKIGGSPVYEEILDNNRLTIKRKIRVEFIVPAEEDWSKI